MSDDLEKGTRQINAEKETEFWASSFEIFSEEVEQALIGSVFVTGDSFYKAAPFVKAEDFHFSIHREIWSIISKMMASNQAVDHRTVKQPLEAWLKKHPAHTPVDKEGKQTSAGSYLSLLAFEFSVTTWNVEDYAKIVRGYHIRRQMVGAAKDAAMAAVGTSPDRKIGELLDEVAGYFADIRDQNKIEGSANDMRAALQESLNRSADAYKQGIVPGIPWCLPELETITGEPIQYGSVYGMLGDSGGGKTSLAMQQLYHAASLEFPSIMYSYEQTPTQCVDQIHSQQLKLEARLIRQGRISMEDFDKVHLHADKIVKWPMAIQAASGCSVSDLRVRTQSFIKRHRKPPLVIIDHAKRIQPAAHMRGEGLSEKVNQIFGDLKSMAMDLGAAVIVLMQRNARNLDRTNPAPADGDAYGGGGTKENLDYLIAVWREVKWFEQRARLEKNGDRRDELLSRADKVRDKAELINLKARFAKDGLTREVKFLERWTRFESQRSDSDQADLIGYDV